MKRSEINTAIIASKTFFEKNGWSMPPNPRWDVTDFGLGQFSASGLVLLNLAEEPEYCEKLMYAAKDQVTPAHTHKKKKEDIICRTGILAVQLWAEDPETDKIQKSIEVKIDGIVNSLISGTIVELSAGQRVTIQPGIWHMFYAVSAECIIGEVSTANDDLNDNFFSNPNIGRFSQILEDEPAIIKLLSDK
jgi:D-lyxose ketol-isomerase